MIWRGLVVLSVLVLSLMCCRMYVLSERVQILQSRVEMLERLESLRVASCSAAVYTSTSCEATLSAVLPWVSQCKVRCSRA